ncbi:alpha-galactosidase [Paludicola sp. MB14-C6]|uniref:glycoside hydrolase family 36 protein n=1 Tax=Paludihabitans sp. MB14-C6 TaxID=3070656 RepID=UPI0027DC6EE9|nr:glycoside hydrolase family 36 protein [Paludicola sp. MB14-C6]WMJ23701.1 alpha-galactosidase [Paludicola sp. MB14-C6]
MYERILRMPDKIIVETQQNLHELKKQENTAHIDDIRVYFSMDSNSGLDVYVEAKQTPLKNIRLRWNISIPNDCRFLGDALERSYGDLEWRGLVPDRAMPWYFLMNNATTTIGYGVKVRPSSLCFWQVDTNGITLWLDVRNGGNGVVLGNRTLKICSIVNEVYEHTDPFIATQNFCKVMCTDPILPKEPVYGFNNWYSSYGDISEQQVLEDTDELCKIVGENIDNRPFMVIDDGWQIAHKLNEYNGGPWHSGNSKFPDMKKLAQAIKKKNCKPGIWVRLLHTSDQELPSSWRLKKNYDVLDPSVPAVLDYIKQTIRLLVDWGYELIKHDFSTNDLFNCWGFQMNPSAPESDWEFADKSKTTAEIIINLYETILDATDGHAYILGCNCIGHLGAGLMHIQRIGDDVSGICWERTRKYGINTLAFRLPQHKTFFDIDADCIGITDSVPWRYNSQWADLIGRSGTPMFVSAKLQCLSEKQRPKLIELFQINSKQSDSIKPLDWMDTVCPSTWVINGNIEKYDWYEENGLSSFHV